MKKGNIQGPVNIMTTTLPGTSKITSNTKIRGSELGNYL